MPHRNRATRLPNRLRCSFTSARLRCSFTSASLRFTPLCSRLTPFTVRFSEVLRTSLSSSLARVYFGRSECSRLTLFAVADATRRLPEGPSVPPSSHSRGSRYRSNRACLATKTSARHSVCEEAKDDRGPGTRDWWSRGRSSGPRREATPRGSAPRAGASNGRLTLGRTGPFIAVIDGHPGT